MSYAELRSFLLAKQMHFICMTEHIEQLRQEDIHRVVDECEAHSDSDFLFIPGIEMDCFVIYFLGIKRTPVDFSSNEAIFHSLHRNSSMCVFAHPIKARYRYAQWLIDRCDGVEVLNTKHDGTHYLRPQSERLRAVVLRERPQAVALAGMDFHDSKHYTDVRLRLTRTGPLQPEFVLAALKDGAFQIVKAHRALAEFGFLERAVGRARIHLMDAGHGVHRTLVRWGLRVPKTVRRRLRRLLEGA